MKCQSLLSGKNKKYFKLLSADIYSCDLGDDLRLWVIRYKFSP